MGKRDAKEKHLGTAMMRNVRFFEKEVTAQWLWTQTLELDFL